MAKSCIFILALVTLVATAAAQACKPTMIDQVGMLMSTTPPGCIQTNEVLTMGLNATCFDSVKLNATNSTGCPGGGITFNVSFVDEGKCFEGPIGGGEMTPAGAGYTVTGEFLTGTPFKGTVGADGSLVVSADGVACDLKYMVETVNGTTAADATMPAMNATKAPAAAPAAPAKSGAAAAATTAATALLGAVFVMLAL